MSSIQDLSPVSPAAFFLILNIKLKKEMQQPILLYIKSNEVYFHWSICATYTYIKTQKRCKIATCELSMALRY